MLKMDGAQLSNMKQWQCRNNKDHVLGVIERVQMKLQVKGITLSYFTSRLIIFREAIDRSAEIPTEIDVAGTVDGKLSSVIWRCSECNCIKEWHPDDEITDYLVRTYFQSDQV